MTHVGVHTPTLLLDRTTFTGSVKAALGVEPLPPSRNYVQAPWLTVDGRIHAPTSYFLAHHCRSSPNQKTASRMAHSLADRLRFLITERGHASFSDHRDPVLTATEDDFAAYHRARQYGVTPDGVNPDLEITSDSWRFTRSAIKRLYEYLHRRHGHPVPFPLVNTRFNGFTGTGVAGYRPRRTSTGSAGTPIDPHFTQLLLQAALRIDRDGNQSDYAGAERDHALLSLAFASGLRRSNLSHVTHYEVPAATPRRDFTVMHVADHITKGDAGGDAMVFSHYLPAVWAYIHGRRTELAEDARHRPDKPLHVLTATEAAVIYTDPDNDQQRSPRPRPWARLDAATRRRLVDPDGSSPVLFLNTYLDSLGTRPLRRRAELAGLVSDAAAGLMMGEGLAAPGLAEDEREFLADAATTQLIEPWQQEFDETRTELFAALESLSPHLGDLLRGAWFNINANGPAAASSAASCLVEVLDQTLHALVDEVALPGWLAQSGRTGTQYIDAKSARPTRRARLAFVLRERSQRDARLVSALESSLAAALPPMKELLEQAKHGRFDVGVQAVRCHAVTVESLLINLLLGIK